MFTGNRARATLARAEGLVEFNVTPPLFPVPRVRMLADAPAGRSVMQSPTFYQISRYLGIGRPYHVRILLPEFRPGLPATQPEHEEKGVRHRLPERPEGCFAQTVSDTLFPQSEAAAELGRVEYYMLELPPDEPHVVTFDARLSARSTPMHLVLSALAPLPIGRVRILAVTSAGRPFYATIDATPTRREVRFPRAMLWGDWSDEQLATECVFTVENFHRWPNSTVRFENFSPLDPAEVEYVRTEPAD